MAWGMHSRIFALAAPFSSREWVAAIVRTLASAARNSLPLATALRAMGECPPVPILQGGRLRVIETLTGDLENGVPLSHAIGYRLGRYLPPYVEDAIAAAEECGALPEVLDILAENTSRGGAVTFKVGTLFVYPCIQFSVLASIVSGLMIFIVPKFSKIFDEMLPGEPLPALTQLVISAAHRLLPWFALVPLFAIAAPVVVIAVIRSRIPEQIGVFLPLVGRHVRKLSLLEFSQAMAVLTASGRDLVGAAALSASASSSPVVRSRADAMVADIRNGVSWVEAWQGMRLGQPVHDWIVRNAGFAEDPVSGFRTLNEWLTEEIGRTCFHLLKLVEPCLILANAILVGAIVVALFLPLIKLITALARF